MLSIIFTGRNDSFGGNFEQRVYWHLSFNSKWLRNYKIEFEYIFVEWNPVNEKPYLSESIKKRFPFVKCFIVDSAVHDFLSENKYIPLHEYFAKNIGARRSNGDFVLFTNADILLGKKTLEYLSSTKIDEFDVIRNHRLTIQNNPDLLNLIMSSDNALDILETPHIWENFAHAGGPPCTAASGDFTMCSRKLLNLITGYDEKIKFAIVHLDSRFLYRACQFTNKFHVIDKAYHIDHNKSYHERSPLDWKRFDVERCTNWNYVANLNNYNNGNNWGYVDLLDEVTLDSGLVKLLLKPEYKNNGHNYKDFEPAIPREFR